MINVKAGTVDNVLQVLKKKRSVSKDIMVVTGRADVCLILDGEINEINKFVTNLKKITDVVSTETLIEVEVDMGW
jgi:ssRNA-specific RNase YbeY (16S rRNA maturation enzyme)